ncbi:MAG: hypothetical protein KF736_01750 [Acidobacteria bacterium]|nr:hypothetical protein [Acidobacteriota bacterium]MCW5948201.1 hypothetical protein [Pyrinomonadaceae bacterium]
MRIRARKKYSRFDTLSSRKTGPEEAGTTRFEDGDVGLEFTWAEVAEVHRSRNGIYQRGGLLISLLTDFGRINPCYPDLFGGTPDVIHYTGAGRRGNQKLDAANRALLDAVGVGIAVPLFNKLGVNRWQFLGRWAVTSGNYVFDESQSRMVWKFALVRER